MALLSTSSSLGQGLLLNSGLGSSSHPNAALTSIQLKALELLDLLQTGRLRSVAIPHGVAEAISEQGLSLSAALTANQSELPEKLRQTLPRGCYSKILSLAAQQDEINFLRGVYELAVSLKQADHKPEALLLIQWLEPRVNKAYPELSLRVAELLTLLTGGGSLVNQVATLASEAASAEFLAPMVTAQLSFGLTRIGLARTVMKNWSHGAKLIGSGIAAFSVEGGAFAFTGQQVSIAQGRLPQALSESLPHAYWTMAWLRGAGIASSTALASSLGAKVLTRLGSRAKMAQVATGKVGEALGVHLSHTQAYRVNLGPEHVENAWYQTGRTMLTFAMGGAILRGALPGYAHMTETLHQETARTLAENTSGALRRLQQTTRFDLKPQHALAAEGPAGEIRSPGEELGLMSFRLRDYLSSIASNVSPATHSGNTSRSNAKRGGLSAANFGMGVVQGLTSLRINAWHQPGEPLPSIGVENSLPLPKTHKELVLRSRATGMGRDALARIRRDLSRLEGTPETQKAYLELAARIERETQKQLADPLGQLLERWPTLELTQAEAAGEAYTRALANSKLGGHQSFQEAHLLEARVRELRTLEDYGRLDEATLARWNVHPDGLHAPARHAQRLVHDPLLRHHLEIVLNHELLATKSATITFRQSLEAFEGEFQRLQKLFQEGIPRLQAIDREIAANKNDVAKRCQLEAERSAINEKTKGVYKAAEEKLNTDMATFLANPDIARFYIVQMRRLQLRSLAITHAPASWLRKQLTQDNIEALASPLARKAAQELLSTEAQLELAQQRGPVSRFGQGLAYFLRLSSESPLTILGRNLQARFALRSEVPHDFWDFSPPRNGLNDLLSAQENWRGAWYEAGQAARSAYREAGLTNSAHELWESYDHLHHQWSQADLGLQMLQITESLERRGFDKESYPEKIKLAKQDAEREMTNFAYPEVLTQDPMSRNRLQEKAQNAVANFRRAAGKEIGQKIRGFSLISGPYGERKDNSGKISLRGAWPMIRHGIPNVIGFLSGLHHGEAEAVHWHFTRYGIKTLQDSDSRLVRSHDGGAGNITYMELLDSLFISGHHDSWGQFFLQAPQAEKLALVQSLPPELQTVFGDVLGLVPEIKAKPGLSQLVPSLFGEAIETFTLSSGNLALERDLAHSTGQAAMSLGNPAKNRRGPGNQLRYDQGTMGVAGMSALGLMGLDGLNASILPPIGHGRSLIDADGLAALGIPSHLTTTMGRGSYQTYGKPDGAGVPTMAGPSVVSSRFHIGSGFIDPRIGPDRTSANLLRTSYLLHTLIPENRPHIAEAAAQLNPYRKPVSLEMEAQIAEAFGGSEFYATRDKLGEVYREIEDFREIIRNYAEDSTAPQAVIQRERLGLLQQVYQQESIEVVGRELRTYQMRLGQEIAKRLGITVTEGKVYEGALVDAKRRMKAKNTNVFDRSQLAEILEMRRYQRILASRERLLDQMAAKLAKGEGLEIRERKIWEMLQATYAAGPENIGQDPLLRHVEIALEEANPYHLPPETELLGAALEQAKKIPNPSQRRQAIAILEKRLEHAVAGLQRRHLGQTLTPVQERVLNNLQNTSYNSQGPKDPLVVAILNHAQLAKRGKALPAEAWGRILAEEKIRETYRDRIDILPGQGTGSIDPLTEVINNYNRVALDGVGNVVAGPQSIAKTYEVLPIFLGGALTLGAAGAVDMVTFGKLDLYSRLNGPICRFLMNRLHWRPVVDAESVHHIEETVIQAKQEGRPVELNSNHLDWTDITTLNAIFYEARFSHKKALWAVPGLNAALIGGRHSPLTRPSSRNSKKLAKQQRQAQQDILDAGDRMRRHGVFLTNFLPGTRSNLIGSPKTGPARIALGTEPIAMTAAISMLGPEGHMGKGADAFTKGFGTHRRIYFGVHKLDPKDVLVDRKNISGSKNVKPLTKATHDSIEAQHLDQLAHLQAQASWDPLAAAQWAETYARMQPGLELLHKPGQEPALDAWLRKSKTDPKFLEAFAARFNNLPASQRQEGARTAAQ